VDKRNNLSMGRVKQAEKLEVLNSATTADIFTSKDILYLYRGVVARFPLSGSELALMLEEYSGDVQASFPTVCRSYGVEPWEISALERLYPIFAEYIRDINTSRAQELEQMSIDIYSKSIEEQLEIITDDEGRQSSAAVTHIRNRSVQLMQAARLLNKSRHDTDKTDGTTININNSNNIDNSAQLPTSLEDVYGLDITALSEISDTASM